jgi:ubiquinone/menaquinone biosynthesis C-methylase UbiE
MIERTRKEALYSLLDKNPDWKVIDIASSNAGWKQADIYTDVIDRSEFYKKRYNDTKKFIQCDVENTGNLFKDKEFDFVIASHILEHVEDPFKFCEELSRIGKRGYIEVPTPLWDNLVDGPHFVKYGHKWWVTYDDVDKSIVINKKINIVDKFLTIPEHNLHMQWFRDSAITMLYWEGDIKIKKGNGIYGYDDNRDIKSTFDSNKIEDWNHKFLFKFGSNPKHRF